MSNSDSIYKIVGIVPYTAFYPAFALPILAHDDRPGVFFVQVMSETSQEVINFIRLDDFDEDDLTIRALGTVALGENYNHAFIDRRGEVYLDTIVGLRQLLLAAVNRSITPLTTKLAILEQLGDVQRQAEVRAKLVQSISDRLGAQAGAAYRQSTLRSRFWDLLVAAAANPPAADRIRRVRPRLDAQFSPGGAIDVEVSALDVDRDLNASLSSIVCQLSHEFGGETYEPQLRRIDLSEFGTDPTSDDILRAVQSSPRQEERVAILIRALLVHPTAGLSALRRVNDNARYACAVVEKLRRRVGENMHDRQQELVIASLIPKMLSDAYPMRRGEMAYYLAAHLADFPYIASVLSDRMARSNDVSFSRYRPAIEEMLKS
jgi:hypothetical protein